MTVLERPAVTLLPERFVRWFASRGWAPRLHQLELLAKARAGRSVLLIAPTGAGKTLAGFLPSLVDLSTPEPRRRSVPLPPRSGGEGLGVGGDLGVLVPPTPDLSPPFASLMGGGEHTGSAGRPTVAAPPRRLVSTGRGVRREGGLHTLYISPLKALAVDIARNLETPVAEMGAADPDRDPHRRHAGVASASASAAIRRDILLTTPEQLALLLASRRCALSVRLAQAHRARRTACAGHLSKRGDLLALGLARLFRLAPDITTRRSVGDRRRAGRSAPLSGAAAAQTARRCADLVLAEAGAPPDVAHARYRRAAALGRPFRASRDQRNLRADRAPQDHAGLRQHPQPGRDASSRSSGASTTTTLPSRCITARSTSRSAARSRPRWRPARLRGGGLHLVARSRHRLGRRRSGHQCRRAEGRVAAAAAHRPRQPPASTSRRRPCWCRRTASRCWNAAPRIDAVAENAQDTPPLRTGALDVLAQHVLGARLRRAVPCRRSLSPRCATAAPYARSDARRFRRRASISSRPAATR